MASPPNLQAWWVHLLPESEHDLAFPTPERSRCATSHLQPCEKHCMIKATTERAVSVYKGKALQHDQVTTALLYPLYIPWPITFEGMGSRAEVQNNAGQGQGKRVKMSFSIYLLGGRAKEQVTIKSLSHTQASNFIILNNSHVHLWANFSTFSWWARTSL